MEGVGLDVVAMVASLVDDTPPTHLPDNGTGDTHMITNQPGSDTPLNHNPTKKDTPTNQVVGVKRTLPLAQGQNKKRTTTLPLDSPIEGGRVRDRSASYRGQAEKGKGAVTATPAPCSGMGDEDTHMTRVRTRPPSPDSDNEIHPPHDPGDLERGVASSLASFWEQDKDGITTASPAKKHIASVTLPPPPHDHEALGKRVEGLSVSPNFQHGHAASPASPPHPKYKNTRGLGNLDNIFVTPPPKKSPPKSNPCSSCGTEVTGWDPCLNCDFLFQCELGEAPIKQHRDVDHYPASTGTSTSTSTHKHTHKHKHKHKHQHKHKHKHKHMH